VAEIANELNVAAIKAGAEVRLLKTAELALNEAIEANPTWAANHTATATTPHSTPADIE
jgi:NAD(P)H dehydrogenase (quinone)